MTGSGYSEIFAFIDNDDKATDIRYLHIATDVSSLHISGEHIVVVNAQPVHAEDARVGDNITVAGLPATITTITTAGGKSKSPTGKHAPLTVEGTLIVDDVLVSSYAGVKGLSWGQTTLVSGHTVGVMAHSPLRLAYKLFPSIGLESWHTKEGRHMWTQAMMDHFKETNMVRGMEYSDGIDGEEAFATVALLLLLAVYCVEAAVSSCGPSCCVSAGALGLSLAALQVAEPEPIRPSQPAPSGKQATAAQ